MASNEDVGIEDVTPLGSPVEQISDDDEDDPSPQPAGRRIAHKEMRNISLDEGENKEREETTDKKEDIKYQNDKLNPLEISDDLPSEKRSEDVVKEEDTNRIQALSHSSDFEDISDEDEENEAFSPTEDDNQDDVVDDIDDNIGSPEEITIKSDNELDDENNLDSPNERQVSVDDNEEEEEEKDDSTGFLDMSNENKTQEDDDDEYIDAPVPSPFSDIGDLSGPDHAIISDILKETSDGNHISPELEGFATELEKSEGTVKLSMPTDDEEKSEINQGKSEMTSKADNSLKDQEEKKNAESGPEQGGDVGGLIADIFGESDEEEEFEGFGEDDLRQEKAKLKSRAIISDEDDDGDDEVDLEEKPKQKPVADEKESGADEVGRIPSPDEEESSDDERQKEQLISDFDIMMQKKKEAMRQRRRTKRDFDIINDNDDIIAAMIRKMREAAEEDRMLNQAGRAATKKMKLLDSIVTHLNKSDLQHTFIDCGILPVMKDWLSPLPDHSLPHLMIRKQFLKILSEFPALDKGALKMSGIGRAVMLLFKHPKETRQNRHLAGKIVSHWARPIFGVQTNFKDMSKEDREERDRMNVPSFKKRRLSSVEDSHGGGSSINTALQDEKRPRKPGDKGFIGRARVPRPSNKDYIVRPESNVGYADMAAMGHKSAKKSLSRFEKQMRKYKERKASLGNTSSRAVSISINGSKLSL